MLITGSDAETLRDILEHIHNPEVLDSHPWVARAFTQDAVVRNNELGKVRPGEQLIAALQELFLKIMPGTPPRRGKRLDTRWGEFGILAAQYFAPLQFGTAVPSSLRDAWGRIDQAILFYVCEREGRALSENEIALYKLVSAEREVAPVSTLSDWHRKGIERLANAIVAHERFLEKLPLHQSAGIAAPPEETSQTSSHQSSLRNISRQVVKPLIILLAAFVMIALIAGGLKLRRMYGMALILKEDVVQVRSLINSSPGLEQVGQAGQSLSRLKRDFEALDAEAQPFLWLGPGLKWVPVYGGDLAASKQLLKLVGLLLESSEKSYTALQPMLSVLEGQADLDPSQVAVLLNQAQPGLSQARRSFDDALQLRRELDLEQLSPRLRLLIEQDLDRLMPVMDDGLSAALSLPRLLGAASDGPKTYLILVQNEDELRPTGGFLTAAGTLVMENGKVLSLSFTDSTAMDNWEMPYPAAPWQLQEYMNSPVLLLRDANWFTDFPTTALYAEYLYAYQNSHSVDGVIAFNQHMLALLLQALGPIEVEAAPVPIDADNVINYMRSSKAPPAGQPVPAEWNRKDFMNKLTHAILDRIFRKGNVSWAELGKALFQGLNEHHLLLVLDDPMLAEVTARYGWDGAIHPGAGDFLMVVDSNIGFSKTNAVVDTSLIYDVDLTDPANPTGQLMVTHRNNSPADVVCTPFDYPIRTGEENYPISACYWNYMRVYTPAGTELTDASPQSVSAGWMLQDDAVPGKVDVLEEEIEGVQAFGTLMVVPGSKSLNTRFHFDLPADILQATPGSSWLTYHLAVKKQPGTIAIPLTIRVHLPHGTAIQSTSPTSVIEGSDILYKTDLRTDQEIDIVFSGE